MQKKNKTLRLFMALILTISTVTAGIMPMSVAAASFTDVLSDAYYAEAVAWAVDKGITKGTKDTTFSPDDGCTRAQVVTFLWRAAGQPDATKTSDFSDVAKDEYYTKAVSWAVEKDITKGIGEGKFDPNSTCTRAQIVTFLWRYNSTPFVEDTGAFVDIASNAYYAGAVSWAVEKEITKGTSDTTFSPDNTCTRAQIVTFLYRMDQAETDTDEPHVQDGRITDSWDQIIESVNNGTYKKIYTIGAVKELDLGREGIIDMQIAAFDADELADGSGKAAITWISKQVLKTQYQMNPGREYDLHTYTYILGTGSIGGWEQSEMRKWLKNDIKPLVPSTVRNSIKPVTKYSASYDVSNNRENNTETTDDVWIPSCREVFGPESASYYNLPFESEGPTYTDLFVSSSDRIKQKSGESNAQYWWLRSAGRGSTAFEGVYSGSVNDGYNSTTKNSVAIGFCM